MISLQIREPFRVELVDVVEPHLAPATVLVRPRYGGVCGSDLAAYRGTSWYVTYPRVIGHELSAEVVAVGDGVDGLSPGMPVTALPYFNCGACRACRLRQPNACINNETMGVQRDGAFSDLVLLPAGHVHAGTGIDPRALALVEPFAISYHGARQARVQPGEKVLVMGAGAIGILAAVAAESMGAEAYIADVSETKVSKALADFSLAGGAIAPDEVTRLVDEVTSGEGFDVVIEAAGAPASFLACIEAAGSLGRVVVIGISTRTADFNASQIQRKELTVIGSRGATARDFTDVIALARGGTVDLTRLITRQYPIDQAGRAFEEMHHESGEITKALLAF